jgi:hypothetical protein
MGCGGKKTPLADERHWRSGDDADCRHVDDVGERLCQSGLERHEPRSEPVDLLDEFHHHQLHRLLLTTK